MSSAAIEVTHVWKRFHRGETHDSLRDLVPAMAKRLLGRAPGQKQLAEGDFWALRDVTFDVRPGEALGIIGPNGAGKSTMLKILSRILRPNDGSVKVRGRLCGLIEVAAGFHGDLTGRENIYLNGAILGMKRNEIDKKMDAIIAFSGIEQALDTPVKRFSSGMLARLGFSVAAHMDPEVLLVDEVLSVGDMSFQAKCIARMQESIRQGVTVAFVSHNLQAVASLCSRVIVLAGGQLIADGDPAASLDAYLKASQQSPGGQGDATQPTSLIGVEFKSEGNKPAQLLAPHTPCEMTVTLRFSQDVEDFNIGFIVERTSDLLYCYGASTEECGIPLFRCRAGETLRVRFGFSAHFARGHYRINLNLRNSKASKFVAVFDNLAGFAIDEHVTYSGVVDIGLNVAVERLAVDPA